MIVWSICEALFYELSKFRVDLFTSIPSSRPRRKPGRSYTAILKFLTGNVLTAPWDRIYVPHWVLSNAITLTQEYRGVHLLQLFHALIIKCFCRHTCCSFGLYSHIFMWPTRGFVSIPPIWPFQCMHMAQIRVVGVQTLCDIQFTPNRNIRSAMHFVQKLL